MERVVEGYSTQIKVYRGQLQVGDELIPRISPLRRLILFSETGFVTLDALRWCQEQGICVTQYDRAGRVVLSVTAGQADNPTVRYRQARASEVTRLRIGKELLTDKLDGQARIAKEVLHRPEVAQTILDRKQALGWATSVSELLGYEGQAASAYWSGWSEVTADLKTRVRLPDHWHRFRGRSTGTGAPGEKRNRSLNEPEAVNRGATDPINAVLNYLYRVAESEAQHACLQYGLDPAFGLLHTTTNDRQAATLDLLETARPHADEIALQLFANRLDGMQFLEAPHGVVHLGSELTQELAMHWREFAAIIRPQAKKLAELI